MSEPGTPEGVQPPDKPAFDLPGAPRMSNVSEVADTPKPRPKRPYTLLVVMLIGLGSCLGLLALGATLFLPVLERGRMRGQRNLCMRNARDIARASLMYATDNDGRLAPGAAWTQAVTTYNNRPADAMLSCPTARFGHPARFGLAQNKKLVGAPVESIQDSQAALVFDSKAMEKGAVAEVDTMPNPGRHVGRRRGNVQGLISGGVRYVRDPEPQTAQLKG